MKKAPTLVLLLLLLSFPAVAAELKSPNGQIAIHFDLTDNGGLRYDVVYRDKPVVTRSLLGLETEESPNLVENFRVTNVAFREHNETWKPVYGERSEVRDHYREMVVDLAGADLPTKNLQLTFRAHNQGVAFRYTIPRQPPLTQVTITGEKSEFGFAADHLAWAVYTAQGNYSAVHLSEIQSGCERPLTIRMSDDLFMAVAEARLVDYARMKLGPRAEPLLGLVSELSGPVTAVLPLTTPWRVIMIADSPGELLENNDMILNLNDPCAIDDTSWIKPGKVIREVTLTTIGGKACVDFAAEHNLQYVEFDAGWYGPENNEDSDARTVNVDPKRSPGPLDLPEVIRYAGEREIGVLLYVNRRALERQLDEILPLYRQWGIKGAKYGFVNVGSQHWTTWLHEAVRKAAENRLMVDVHDEYRPTGYSRTYPNLMTQEGIGGDETSPSNAQTLTILFTRMLAGAGDNTICYYSPRVDDNASHAYQLAKAVCLYSPLQFVYWYDRPSSSPQKKGGAGGSQNRIGDEPELEFFDHVPTVWDDTKVIHGQIGRYAVIARQSGDRWFVGSMNSGESRALQLPLDFLAEGRQYTAHIYSDDESVSTRTHVRIEKVPVTRESVLEVMMSAQGGQAMRIEPVTK